MLTHMAKRTAAPAGAAAVIGALGAVFGDIGTSPLYTYQTVVNTPDSTLDRDLIMGTTSMIIWALLLVVTVLYTRLFMRADNAGEAYSLRAPADKPVVTFGRGTSRAPLIQSRRASQWIAATILNVTSGKARHARSS